MEASRKTFIDEFQRLDVSLGTGEIPINDLISLFALNDIYLDENDYKLLENEEILVTKKDKKFIKYGRFMKIIFPDSNPIEKEIMMQAALRLKRFFYRVKAKKEKEKIKEEELKKAQSLNVRKSTKGRPPGRASKKVTVITKSPVKEEAPAKARPKEVYEFEKSSILTTPKTVAALETPAATDRKRSTSAAKRTKRGEPKPLSLEEKLKKTLGEGVKDDRTKERVTAIYNKCKGTIMEIIDNVIAYGESLKLSKEIQKKYEARPVMKDVFVTLQDLELGVMDLIPRSLSISTMTGRATYMDKDGSLYQYDIANKQALKSVNLSSKVPLKKSKIIDYAFDDKAGRMYTLTDSWMLEVWEIHQDLTVPVGRLKILTEIHDPNAISNTYFKRYGDSFPHFMVLSSSSHQLLIINCSCINNSIVFVDPVSVSIFSQVYLKQEDYRIPEDLTKILYYVKPKIDDMVKNSHTFEKIFESHFILQNEKYVVPKAAFIEQLKTTFDLKLTLSDRECIDILFE